MKKLIVIFVALILTSSFLLLTSSGDLKAGRKGVLQTKINMKNKMGTRGREITIPLTEIKKGVTKPTDSGKAFQEMSNCYTSCFTPDMTESDIVTFSQHASKIYRNAKVPVPDFIKHKAIAEKYGKWNFATTEGDKKKALLKINPVDYKKSKFYGIFLKRLRKFYLGSEECPMLKGETPAAQLERCSKKPYILECAVDYNCPFDTGVRETTVETPVPECSTGPETFKSNSAVISKSAEKKICSSLSKIPKEAVDIKIGIECCSTTTRRKYGDNSTLTNERLAAVKSFVIDELAKKGFDDLDYGEIEIKNENENVYFNPTAKGLVNSGTCGPLTDKNVHEDWIKHAEATKNYINTEREDPEAILASSNFAWLRNSDKVTVGDDTTPDDSLSKWRFNKVYINYKTKTKTVHPPVKTLEPSNDIVCLKLLDLKSKRKLERQQRRKKRQAERTQRKVGRRLKKLDKAAKGVREVVREVEIYIKRAGQTIPIGTE